MSSKDRTTSASRFCTADCIKVNKSTVIANSTPPPPNVHQRQQPNTASISRCVLCPKAFISPRYLRRHMVQHHTLAEMHAFLLTHGLNATAAALQNEANLPSVDDIECRHRTQLFHHAKCVTFGLQCDGEMELLRKTLTHFTSSEFPYAVEAEWDFEPGQTHKGRGDLVFASIPAARFSVPHPPCCILVIEIKCLTTATGKTARTRRRKSRRKVEDQIERSMRGWRTCHPGDKVVGAVITNDTLRAGRSAEVCSGVWLSYL